MSPRAGLDATEKREISYHYKVSRTMAVGSTQRLTEISIRNLPGSKGRPVRKADNLIAICEPIV
jgi:hypothetical protein